jgi:branched-chain amino acid transport system ATP-binding protein
MSDLEIDDVSVRFGGIAAVSNVSFSVQPGELVGIVGPNGAGKTTLLNAITSVIPTETGAVSFRGAPIGATPQTVAAGLARTFQSPEHFQRFTAFEYVSMGLVHKASRSVTAHGLGLPRSRRDSRSEHAAVTELLAEHGLTQYSETALSNLPYGVQKLVDCVRALASKPECLLLDEPTSGVSSNEREKIHKRLTSLNGHGLTIVVIDHDVPFIRRLCTRLLVMASGRLIADGRPGDVLARQDVIDAYLGA